MRASAGVYRVEQSREIHTSYKSQSKDAVLATGDMHAPFKLSHDAGRLNKKHWGNTGGAKQQGRLWNLVRYTTLLRALGLFWGLTLCRGDE